VAGFFSIGVLTTNVTGHFAHFADDIIKQDFGGAGIFLMYILSFLTGAFVSNTILETGFRLVPRYAHTLPILVEVVLLSAVAFTNFDTIHESALLIACILLFAMGLQNATVTRISNAVVRTTHLTGLLTDLGIDLSQLLFYSRSAQRRKLTLSLVLRLSIIVFFFLGGIVGGVGFSYYQNKILLVAIVCLVVGAAYSTLRYQLLVAQKHWSHKSHKRIEVEEKASLRH